VWIDLYAGEGNLILPILEFIPKSERTDFFKSHIYLFDIHSDMVSKCIENAVKYGIPVNIAQNNIKPRDNLSDFPKFLIKCQYPIFHITNPPYLYLGYIRKHKETQKYFPYFEGLNKGYQDLYQIAMINDLRNNIENLIYIIPSNFLYGSSVSNKFRLDFLKYYNILKMIIFEIKIFKYTGTNICIGFFKNKDIPKEEISSFEAIKVKKKQTIIKKQYNLNPKYKYRAGSEFEEFFDYYKTTNPLKVIYYLRNEDLSSNKGNNKIKVIDANDYSNNEYKTLVLQVNDYLRDRIKSNILYVRTVDTGSYNGRAGLGIIEEAFHVNGIYVSGNTYRTHPIQIFIQPQISIEDQILLKDYFNFCLEYFRKKLDSEFLTTYKYSDAEYTRKYLGLTQVRKLIETFPIMNWDNINKRELVEVMEKNDFNSILTILKKE